MKKALIFALLFVFTGSIMAADAVDAAGNTMAQTEEQKEKTIIVYDVYKHMENSSNIFLGIGGLSFAMGTALASTAGRNTLALGVGLQSVIWGASETAIYLLNKNFGEKEMNPEKARKEFAEMSGWHAVVDLVIMAGGGCLAVLGGNDDIKAHGLGIMIQGAMLATYDGINFFIANNPQDVKDWGAGVGYNVRFASK